MDFLDNTKRLYQEVITNLELAKAILENDFDPKKCSLSSDEEQELNENPIQFKKAWAYKSTLLLDDSLQDVLFVVHFFKYAIGYSNYLKAINEKVNVDLDKFSTLAYYELPMILKKLKPMIDDYDGGLYSLPNSGSSSMKQKKNRKPRKAFRNSELNQVETAKLFLALSNAGALPQMADSRLAELMKVITDFHVQNSRVAMRYDIELDRSQKKKIKDLLRLTMKVIDTF